MKGIYSQKNKSRGFTLVELIIVIAIIAAVVAVLAPSYLRYIEKSKKSVCDANRVEIQRLFVVNRTADSSKTAEEIKDALVLEYAGSVCPSGGVSAESFKLENNKLSVVCLVHGATGGAGGGAGDTGDTSATGATGGEDDPPAAIDWRSLAPSIDDIRDKISNNTTNNFFYTTGQVYYANGSYYVVTGTGCGTFLTKDGTDEVIEQEIYVDLNARATNISGSQAALLDTSFEPIAYAGDEVKTINKGDLALGSGGELYISKRNASKAKSPDLDKSLWVRVLTD